MSGLQDARAAMEEKQKLKRELIGQLKTQNDEIAKMREAIARTEPARPTGKDSPRRVARLIEALEFQISTSAFTPAQEKELLRRMGVLQKQLAEAQKANKSSAKLDEQYGTLRSKLEERSSLRKQINALGDELEQIYQAILKESAEHAKKRQEAAKAREERKERHAQYEGRKKAREEHARAKEEERKEMEPYMKTHDSFVSMEEIAIVQKKGKKDGEE